MMLTNEDLSAMSQLLDTKLDSVFELKLEPIKEDVEEIRVGMCDMRKDITSVDRRLGTVETELVNVNQRLGAVESGLVNVNQRLDVVESGLVNVNQRLGAVESGLVNVNQRLDVVETELVNVNQRLDVIEPKLADMENRLVNVEFEVKCIHLEMENTIQPQICLLAENYVPAAKRFEKEAEHIESMQDDIDIMKKVITGHSEVLQRLA